MRKGRLAQDAGLFHWKINSWINSRVNSRVLLHCQNMARRALNERNIRKLTRTGRGQSVSVTLPIEFIRNLGWRDRQKVVVSQKGKKLIIEDWE